MRVACELLTVGHGTLAADDLSGLLRGTQVELVVDVRRFPGSRRHPQFMRDSMAEWLPTAGVAYEWEERLGGRRHGAPDSPNLGLRNTSFRAYADYMATDEFRGALDDLVSEASERRVAVMCAESVWWRCHRRLIADAATLLHGVEVRHLMHDGKLREHAVTEGATVDDGTVVFPESEPKLL